MYWRLDSHVRGIIGGGALGMGFGPLGSIVRLDGGCWGFGLATAIGPHPPRQEHMGRPGPILDEGLYQDLDAYLVAHPRRSEPDAGLWPGKVPGHSIVSYDHAFDPKGFDRYTFKPAARRAGFPELHLHELRHTFATLALESKAVDMHELSRAMGHAS